MTPDQHRSSKPDLIVELTELSRELRDAVSDLAVETKKFKSVLRASDKGIGGPPEIVAANHDHQIVLKRLNGIWDRARKPIINLGMTSNHGDKLLAEFRCLSLRPEPLEVLKFVEFLEVALQVDSTAATKQPCDANGEFQDVAAPPDNIKSHVAKKRERGRPVEIPEDRKTAAWEVMKKGGSAHEVAQILYNKRQPTKRERDNVYSILKAFSKKRGASAPPD